MAKTQNFAQLKKTSRLQSLIHDSSETAVEGDRESIRHDVRAEPEAKHLSPEDEVP